jgi:endonuclease YncB( thermonuclease family)
MGIRCPKCGAEMRRRVAKRGRNKGREFWGCSRYPACKGIVGGNIVSLNVMSRASKPSKIRLTDIKLGIGVFLIVSVGLSVWYEGDPRLAGLLNRGSKGPGETIVGRASVIDGDTIEIRGQRIRFNGIDAPETDQLCFREGGERYHCGRQSANFLDSYLAASRPTTCNFVEWDQYDRYVGDCYRADGESVAVALVTAGHALDWPRYSSGAYADYQANASAKKSGVWQGAFEKPWDYRARKRSEQQEQRGEDRTVRTGNGEGNCNIKGNISVSTGARIYHLPGQEFYDKTQINTGRGERWFCSETEARAAGWRRAQR